MEQEVKSTVAAEKKKFASLSWLHEGQLLDETQIRPVRWGATPTNYAPIVRS
jgi:hypothetical protein